MVTLEPPKAELETVEMETGNGKWKWKMKWSNHHKCTLE